MKFDKFTIFILAFLLCNTPYLNACKCDYGQSLENEYNHIDLVIHGKVVKVSQITVGETMNKEKAALLYQKILRSKDSFDLRLFQEELILKVIVEIEDCFKGQTNNSLITLFTAVHSGACGFRSFKVGDDFLIYASYTSYLYYSFDDYQIKNLEQESTFWTNHCTRTKKFDFQEAKTLKELSNN